MLGGVASKVTATQDGRVRPWGRGFKPSPRKPFRGQVCLLKEWQSSSFGGLRGGRPKHSAQEINHWAELIVVCFYHISVHLSHGCETGWLFKFVSVLLKELVIAYV